MNDYLPKAERFGTAGGDSAIWLTSGRPARSVEQMAERLMPLEKLNAIAQAVDLPRTLAALDSLPADKAPLDTVRYAHLVRRRFTLGDMLSALGWLQPERIEGWLGNSSSV